MQSSKNAQLTAGLALDAQGNLYVADTGNHAIRKITPAGQVSTLAGTGEPGFRDGPAAQAQFNGPLALAVTHDGVLYAAMMSGGTVLQIAPDGQVHLLLGKTGAAPLSRPTALLLDGPGLLLSDATSRRIHRLQPAGSSSSADGPLGSIGPAADAALPDTRQRWPLQPQLAWHEVVGTPGEVRGDVGATVLAMADAKVSSPLASAGFGGLNESLSLDGLSYVHLRVGRSARGELLDPSKFQLLRDASGKPERVRVRRGTRFHAGEALGSINTMAHVHLTLGAPGYLRSPFALDLAQFVDHQPPRIGIDFARLPFSDDAARIAYAEGSGITVHGSKQTRFLYQLTSTVKDGGASPGLWQPGAPENLSTPHRPTNRAGARS